MGADDGERRGIYIEGSVVEVGFVVVWVACRMVYSDVVLTASNTGHIGAERSHARN